MAASSEVADGPVLSLMSKRLRALRKKYNRIIQMEENVAQGKPLNKEQEEALRSKPGIVAVIDEYEKLRHPLSLALQEERSLLLSSYPPPQPSPPTSPPPPESPSTTTTSAASTSLEDLLQLLYFGSLFDVKPQSEFTSTMLTRTHERECCLTYDYVTDDATDLLGEADLDFISALGALVTARPAHSGLSHKNALRSCLDHAMLWLSLSDQPILPSSSATYAGLRQRLNKILSSDYFTTTPEMKAPVDVAAAAGKYASSQVPVQDLTVPSPAAEEEGATQEHQYEEKDVENENFQEETPVDHSSVEDHQKENAETLNAVGDPPQQDQLNQPEGDVDEHIEEGVVETEQHFIPRRAYQGQRGGGRAGGGGGRRGYTNGRGGRGGRGGGNYQNGRSQYYDSGSYYSRNYNNNRGRGGSRAVGATAPYNNHGMRAHSHVGVNVESARS